MKRVLMIFAISFITLSASAQWGGWGDDSGEGGSSSGSGSSGSSTGGGSTGGGSGTETPPAPAKKELAIPTIGTHYDDAPDARYEPPQTTDDGRPAMEEATVMARPYLREADVKFKRRIWRRIDVRQKLNKSFTWPRNPFTKNIYELATQGKVKAYVTDSLNSYYTPEDAWQRGSTIDVIEVPTEGYEDDPTMNQFIEVASKFEWDLIKQIEICEDWIFDYKHSEFRPRIIAIAPIYTRTIMGMGYDEPLFWLSMDELRPWLVKSEVYNRYNDAARISWDDLFNHYRIFDSYIVKTTDWDDKYIAQKQEFAQNGLAALIEGEKIKNDLFLFEHDLWEY